MDLLPNCTKGNKLTMRFINYAFCTVKRFDYSNIRLVSIRTENISHIFFMFEEVGIQVLHHCIMIGWFSIATNYEAMEQDVISSLRV